MKNKYFDYNLAMQYLANNDGILRKIVNRFLLDYKDFINELDEDIYAKIHSLKGITLNLGAKALYYECQTVLEAIKKEEKYTLSSFIDCFDKTYDALNTFINKD